jgi:hypothetical protein
MYKRNVYYYSYFYYYYFVIKEGYNAITDTVICFYLISVTLKA